jgi:superfamily II DNA or RNA helicase
MVVIKKALVSDKIYIKDSDIEDINNFQETFRYTYGNEIHSPIEFEGEYNTLPSNSLDKLKVKELEDKRVWIPDKTFLNESVLRPDQKEVYDWIFEGGIKSGIVQARCGWGKTYLGCHVIANAGVKSLVVVHTKLLFRQWVDELSKQIKDVKIGMIGDGICQVGDITVAIYLSLKNHITTLGNYFSLMIVDEVHRCPADLFSSVINSFAAKIKIGFSATPRRKDGKHLLLPDYFSGQLWVANDKNVKKVPYVEIVDTDIPFNVRVPKRDWSKAISTLCGLNNYAELIAKLAREDIIADRCILICSDRIILLDALSKLIPNSIKIVGPTEDKAREEILKALGSTYKVILTTTIFDEGISAHRLDTLYLTCPSSNLIKLEQRIGRIERDHTEKQWPKIVDFWLRGMIVAGQQNNRARWFKMVRDKPEKKTYEIKYRNIVA